MSARRTMRIALAFVGLVVAAGFATGQELIQYFLSFGAIGILGATVMPHNLYLHSALVQSLVPAPGMSEAGLDALFTAAAAL